MSNNTNTNTHLEGGHMEIEDRDGWLDGLAKRAAAGGDRLLSALLEYDRCADDDDPDRYFETINWLVDSGADQWASFGDGDPGEWWFVVRYGDILTRIDWEGSLAQHGPYDASRYDAAETVEDLMWELHQHRRVRRADDATVIIHAADPDAVAGAVDEADRSRTWTVRVGGSAHRVRQDSAGRWELMPEAEAEAGA